MFFGCSYIEAYIGIFTRKPQVIHKQFCVNPIYKRNVLCGAPIRTWCSQEGGGRSEVFLLLFRRRAFTCEIVSIYTFFCWTTWFMANDVFFFYLYY